MRNRNILISGAGICGTSLAYWLKQYGFNPTLVERAPAFRTGGYIIDFWGIGYTVAEKMGVLPALRERGYIADEVCLLDGDGKKVGGFDTNTFRKNLGDRFITIQRGDLAEVIFDKVRKEVETIYSDSILSLDEDNDGIDVVFQNGTRRRFDLVIGADGLHSAVRSLAFGSEEMFEKKLGYYAAAFSTEGYRPRDVGAYICYTAPGKQLARFALRNDQTVFFLVFASNGTNKLNGEPDLRKIIENVFGGLCCESAAFLEALQSSNDLYFDPVSQIRMPFWSKGRIALAGDAAYCPSLLAGQGSALAMLGAYVLACELKMAGGDYSTAFRMYEQLLRQFMLKKQKGAERIGVWFAPRSTAGVFVRNQITKLFSIPAIANAFVDSSIADNVSLPDYSRIETPEFETHSFGV
jgi:2-polyprenyl-6-methoxyphenol hydroxylase-like FAD-dependent oxidoreductase